MTRSVENICTSVTSAFNRYCRVADIQPGLAARQATVPSRFGYDLAANRSLPAEYYLRFCELLNLDPETGDPLQRGTPRRRFADGILKALNHGLKNKLTIAGKE